MMSVPGELQTPISQEVQDREEEQLEILVGAVQFVFIYQVFSVWKRELIGLWSVLQYKIRFGVVWF